MDFSDDDEVDLNLAPATFLGTSRSAPSLPLRANAGSLKASAKPPTAIAREAPAPAASAPIKTAPATGEKVPPPRNSRPKSETPGAKSEPTPPAHGVPRPNDLPNPHTGVAVNAVYPISKPDERAGRTPSSAAVAAPADDWTSVPTAGARGAAAASDDAPGAELLVDHGDVGGGVGGGDSGFDSLGLDARIVAKLLAPPGDATKAAPPLPPAGAAVLLRGAHRG